MKVLVNFEILWDAGTRTQKKVITTFSEVIDIEGKFTVKVKKELEDNHIKAIIADNESMSTPKHCNMTAFSRMDE